jgi:hypothetical protein
MFTGSVCLGVDGSDGQHVTELIGGDVFRALRQNDREGLARRIAAYERGFGMCRDIALRQDAAQSNFPPGSFLREYWNRGFGSHVP